MPFELATVIRTKGMIDAVIAQAPKDPFTATPALVDTYINARAICAQLVDGTEVALEFEALFPQIDPVPASGLSPANLIRVGAAGDRALLLLAQLSGWLGSWPSAEELLEELITALETAEAMAVEPEEKARLASLLEGLRGAGRQVAINVVSAYLSRVNF